MSVQAMINEGKLIEIDYDYMTDQGVVLIRCYGGGTSPYWIRDDDLYSVYRSAAGAAYRNEDPQKLYRMRKRTIASLMTYVRSYMSKNGLRFEEYTGEYGEVSVRLV